MRNLADLFCSSKFLFKDTYNGYTKVNYNSLHYFYIAKLFSYQIYAFRTSNLEMYKKYKQLYLTLVYLCISGKKSVSFFSKLVEQQSVFVKKCFTNLNIKCSTYKLNTRRFKINTVCSKYVTKTIINNESARLNSYGLNVRI